MDWPAGGGVFGPFTCIVCGKPLFQIDGDAGVKTVIIAFNNVGVPPHERRCRLPVVFASIGPH